MAQQVVVSGVPSTVMASTSHRPSTGTSDTRQRRGASGDAVLEPPRKRTPTVAADSAGNRTRPIDAPNAAPSRAAPTRGRRTGRGRRGRPGPARTAARRGDSASSPGSRRRPSDAGSVIAGWLVRGAVLWPCDELADGNGRSGAAVDAEHPEDGVSDGASPDDRRAHRARRRRGRRTLRLRGCGSARTPRSRWAGQGAG